MQNGNRRSSLVTRKSFPMFSKTQSSEAEQQNRGRLRYEDDSGIVANKK